MKIKGKVNKGEASKQQDGRNKDAVEAKVEGRSEEVDGFIDYSKTIPTDDMEVVIKRILMVDPKERFVYVYGFDDSLYKLNLQFFVADEDARNLLISWIQKEMKKVNPSLKKGFANLITEIRKFTDV
jgi:hypothetical protein